jgi:hypothetical protein
MEELFKGRHFEQGIMIPRVCWYLRFKLSLRDLVEIVAERGLAVLTHEHPALGSAIAFGKRHGAGKG